MQHKLLRNTALLLISLLISPQVFAAKSFIEYSKLARSDTLRDVNALGFYTIFSQARDHQLYLGLEIALFEPDAVLESEIATHFIMGIAGTGTFAPYAEVGVGLFDFLANGNDTAQVCNEERNCEPNFVFRAGVRVMVSEYVAIGAFYQGVNFGDYQDRLVGSHGYTGVNIGVWY